MPDPDPDLVATVERAALWAWPPRELHHLRGWLLRARAGIDSRRLNSAQVLAFDAPLARLGDAVGEVERWYGARGLPARFQLTDRHAAPEGLDAALAERGYARAGPTTVMLADAAALDLPPAPGAEMLLHRPGQGVLEAMADPRWGDAARRARATLLAKLRRPHRFGLLHVGGEAAAGGLVVVEGTLAGLFGLRTQVPFRRQGLGRRLVAGLVGWAREQGASRIYLQVEDGNAPAVALYRSQGFTPAYGYWYRERA